MKNFVLKFFTSLGFLEKPVPLTTEQRQTLVIQYTKYVEEDIKIKIEMAFSTGLKSFESLSIQRLMNKQRMSSIRVKLLKNCKCGKDHTYDILTEKKRSEMYQEQLQKYIHS